MPQPVPSDAHVNRALTNISIAFMQDARNFVASRVFPVVPVDKQADAYFVYDRGFFNRDEMKVRAPATESAGVGYELSTATYYCRKWGVHKDVPDDLRANADEAINPDRDATQLVTQLGLIRREKIFVTNYFQASVWANDITGVASSPTGAQVLQWNDASSTPIEDVSDQQATILEATGYEPNKLVVGYQVHKSLKNHPDVIDRLKAGQTPGGPAMASAEKLAEIFEVDEYLVMKSIENTANEGATNSHSFIGGKGALLTYAPPNPGLMVPSGGYSFGWRGLTGSVDGQRIKSFRMDQLDADRVEIDLAVDLKLVSADLGAFWATVVA